jgi:hypothetical protein
LQPVTIRRDGLLVAYSKRQDAREITGQLDL